MQNVSPAYQHYAKEFLAETAINTLAGRGMYITLLDHYWLRGGLPSSTTLLARLCGVTHDEFLPIWETEVKQYFHDNGTTLEHADLIGQKEYQEAKREKARASAGKRWDNQTDKQTDANAYANAMRTHMPTQCTATATAIANKEKRETNVSPKKKPAEIEVLPAPRADVVPALWNEYLEHRARMKKPLTRRAYDLLITDLSKLENFDLNRRIAEAIDRKWQGLIFKDDFNGATNGRNNGLPNGVRISEREKSAERTRNGKAMVAELRRLGEAERNQTGQNLLSDGNGTDPKIP